MRYVPGSHTAGPFRHATTDDPAFALNRYIDDPRFADSDARFDELEPGELSLHDIHLVHGSNANRSDTRRAGLTFRYMPATSLYDRDIEIGSVSEHAAVDFAERPIWLVRGANRAGGNDFSRGHEGMDY